MAAKKVVKKAPARRKRVKVAAAPELSYGEKMVGLTFNPSGDPNVHDIKKLYAKIIDHCHYEALRVEGVQPIRRAFLKLAIDQAVMGQMMAVKGWTFFEG